jgi:chloramphenicol-sensitive protein RarD
VPDARRGFLLGVAAYVMWGAFPLYWPHLEPAGAVEILAHRVLWSSVTMGVLVLALRRRGRLRDLVRDRRIRLLLTLAAAVITVNWVTYIWGVNNDHVVETSLGYFVNPLVTVALAVLVVGEKLRRPQWVAVGIAAVAVVVLTVAYGRPPWIALMLAFSFGFYGLVKKQVGVGGTQSLAVETTFLFLPALACIVILQATGKGTLTTEGAGHVLLLAGGGIATAIPLMLFGAAAVRIPLTTIGLLQYVAPILQFAIGVTIKHEYMPASRWAGFTLVWLAVMVFTWDSLRRVRRPVAVTVRA